MYLIKRILALWLFMGPTVRALFLYPFPHTHAFTLRLILSYLLFFFNTFSLNLRKYRFEIPYHSPLLTNC